MRAGGAGQHRSILPSHQLGCGRTWGASCRVPFGTCCPGDSVCSIFHCFSALPLLYVTVSLSLLYCLVHLHTRVCSPPTSAEETEPNGLVLGFAASSGLSWPGSLLLPSSARGFGVCRVPGLHHAPALPLPPGTCSAWPRIRPLVLCLSQPSLIFPGEVWGLTSIPGTRRSSGPCLFLQIVFIWDLLCACSWWFCIWGTFCVRTGLPTAALCRTAFPFLHICMCDYWERYFLK